MSQLTQRRVKEEETGSNKPSVVIQVRDCKDHREGKGREEKLQRERACTCHSTVGAAADGRSFLHSSRTRLLKEEW